MRDLGVIQSQFIDGIYDSKKNQILSLIKNGKAPKKELLDIYRNNLSGNLINALRITYPRVWNFLKERKFNKIAFEFVFSNRSKTGNLDDYGEDFYKILHAKKEYFLSDLAKLEWFCHKAYLAFDVEKINLKELQLLSEEKLFSIKFNLHPSFHLLTSKYNILSSRKQSRRLINDAHFLIYRHDLEIKINRISKDEFRFIKGLSDDLTLYEIYQKYNLNIGKFLSKYLSEGLIVNFQNV